MTAENGAARRAPFSSVWADLRGTAFSQEWIDVGGVSTRVLAAGHPSLPPLILLHGAGGHAEAYARNLRAHAAHFRTWSVDMVGHGWTDLATHGMEVAHYVEHILRFMDAVGIGHAHFSGESLGGWVASRLAADHPDRVDRLVLNTVGGSQADPKVMERIRTLSQQAADDPSWDFIKARLEWLMADKSMVTDDLVATRQAMYARPGMPQNMRHLMVLQDMETRQRNLMRPGDYGRIRAPTLVLWTSHDPSADVSEGRRIASMIPSARFEVMQGCGHWPQFEDADTFNRLHLDFLLGR